MSNTSRYPGFYRLPVAQRRALLGAAEHDGGLPVEIADRMSENVISCHGLPLSVALNFRVNGRDVLVPMAVEEPSVVAAASRAALFARAGGGFTGDADAPIMTAQIQLDGVEADGAAARLAAARAGILEAGDRAIPAMLARGGGCRDLELRVLDRETGMVVVHIHVEVGNAMGANLVDTVAEATAPLIEACLGGTVGLRILTNLSLRRRVRVRCSVPIGELGGMAATERLTKGSAEGVVRASRFAEADPMRAVTHNKGVMNGIDAAAVALGQDWRAIEAGAHAFASLWGVYRPLSTWRVEADALVGRIELPLAVGTVGGATQVHPGVRAAFALMQIDDARELAVVLASAGLASNLAALHALAGEGIQRGHMRLHARRLQTGGVHAVR
ncbi:MAG TPA: hydroxymethylglutaryl-CoA reductase, degradative [Kofleriaceae bacterium]|nr:hydroxymethylglutaryl-CoA reductase, degradative [Kofleriaceae bacterium]